MTTSRPRWSLLALTACWATILASANAQTESQERRCPDAYKVTDEITYDDHTSKICFDETGTNVWVRVIDGLGADATGKWCCNSKSGEKLFIGFAGSIQEDDWFQVKDSSELRAELLKKIGESVVCPHDYRRRRVSISSVERNVCFFKEDGRPSDVRILGKASEESEVAQWCCRNVPSLSPHTATPQGDEASIWFAVPGSAELRGIFAKSLLAVEPVGVLDSDLADALGEGGVASILADIIDRRRDQVLLILLVLVLVGWLVWRYKYIGPMKSQPPGERTSRGPKPQGPEEENGPGKYEIMLGAMQRSDLIETLTTHIESCVTAALRSELSSATWIEKLAKSIAREIQAGAEAQRTSDFQQLIDDDSRSVDAPSVLPVETQADQVAEGTRLRTGQVAHGRRQTIFVVEARHSGSYTEGLRFREASSPYSASFIVETSDGREGQLKPHLERGDWHPKWAGLFSLTSANWRDPNASGPPIPVYCRDGFWIRR